jgi:hypothetical protein
MHLTELKWCLPEDDLDEMMVWVAEFRTQNPDAKLWPVLAKAERKWKRRNKGGEGKPTTPISGNT